GEVLQIRSADETVQKILYNLFYDVLNIEFNLWSWTRNMLKYGDFYLKLEISEKFGVYNVVPFSSYTILRLEGGDPKNPSDVKFKYDPSYSVSENPLGFQQISPSVGVNTGEEIIFDNYEMAHFRLLSDFNYLPYGRSYLEPGRKIWKQMTLMEDAMLIHRIVRAPEKRTFFVNVGNIPPNEVETYMQRMINKMKKTPYVDPNTGEYNLKFNMQNILEDFYIPVRGGDATTRIETTKGLDYAAIEDVTYLRDKLFSALKVPKAYLGYEADLEGKATLAAEDIRFARTVERIQKILVSELTKIALVHLYSQGYDGSALTNFELSLTTPSIIYDQERTALLKEKVDLAQQMMETKLMPTDWIYDNIFHFSEDQYQEYRDLIIEDQKRKFREAQIETEGNDPAESGEAYGTPHSLASLYGAGRYPGSKGVPTGYSVNDPNYPEQVLDQGRPSESPSNYGT
ncbi:MAG: portal protein, partial [Candidatus Kariarchaeum pelagius]